MNILPIWRTAIVMMGLTCGLAPAATAPARPSRTYTVQSGDTLSKIARKHGVSLSSVLAANRGINPSALNRGQRVVIPGSTAAAPAPAPSVPEARPSTARPESRPSARVPAAKPDPFAAAGLAAAPSGSSSSAHTVRPGETLSSISRSRKVSVANLRAWNKLSSDSLRVGQKLNLSGQSAAAPAPERRPATGDVAEPERDTPPPPAQPAAPQATGTGRIPHIVQKGETFSTIARKHGISWGKLYRANAGVDPESLKPGQRIWVPSSEMVNTTPPPPADESTSEAAAETGAQADPAPRPFAVDNSRPRLVYRVLRGDSAATIARKFKISEADFRRYNRLNGDTLATGDTVYVPAYPGASASAVVSADRGVNVTY